jgi:cysteine desulfurase / selenocysteine lyase
MTFDIEKLRNDTPGVARRAHFNNAGASLMPTPVVDAMVDYIGLEASIGGYEAAYERKAALDAVYTSVARLIGASPDEIALMENATVAWQMAFYSLPFRPGDRILTACAEYAANYVAFLQVAKRFGVVIDVIPHDDRGGLDVDALERMIDHRVRLIALTWVPTNGGPVSPVAEVGRIARARGVRFLVDACQAVGQMQVDVNAIGCDMLSATGRKFLRGPRGTGFLYVRRDLVPELEPPVIDHFGAPWVAPHRYELRADARRFETWENNYAARLGLGVAVDYALSIGLGEIESRCAAVTAKLRASLEEIPAITLHDVPPFSCAIVPFSVEGWEALAVNKYLYERGINVSPSGPSSTLLDATARGLPTMLRASPHYYNSVEEIERLADALRSAPRVQ